MSKCGYEYVGNSFWSMCVLELLWSALASPYTFQLREITYATATHLYHENDRLAYSKVPEIFIVLAYSALYKQQHCNPFFGQAGDLQCGVRKWANACKMSVMFRNIFCGLAVKSLHT